MGKSKDPLKIALNYLSYSDRFSKEVSQRLKREGFTKEEIDSTIEKLKNYGYVNDRKTAEEFIRSKISKGWGPERIKIELMRREISEEEAENLVKSIFSEFDERELIFKLAEKFLRNKKGENIKEKLKGFLFRKGFSYDKIIDVIEKIERKEN